MTTQFPLKLALNRQPLFENFLTGDNTTVVKALRTFPQSQAPGFLYLWGTHHSGKSHLLMSLCQTLPRQSFYLPLKDIPSLTPEILNGLEQYRLICVDDIDRVSGSSDWEEQLFHLYNRIRENRGYMLVSANAIPRDLPIQLEDLKSRLMWGACYQIHPLNDEEKANFLVELAKQRGMQLNEEAASYLIRRCPRETGYLVSLIDDLDSYSLARKKKLTIPLLREWLQG